MELTYDEKQAEAINQCLDLSNRLVGVTGKAGTGKTSIIKEVAAKLTEAGYRVALCAPTGKAAKRVSEATGLVAMTIHRLLEYPYPGERDPDSGKVYSHGVPKKHSRNPLEYDIVLADEYAMVNVEIHRNLLAAIPAGGALRAFGDVNQLRPIESNVRLRKAPSPFQDILERFPSVVLETIHRQGAGSGIARNGEVILNGMIPRRFDDFLLHFTTQPVKILESIIIEAEDEGIDFSHPDYQVISPTKKGWVGTVALNEMLQQIFRPGDVESMVLPRNTWEKHMLSVSVGDKIIWTENDYQLNIMNGETGIVKEITPEEGSLHIDLVDRIVEVPSWVEYEMPSGVKGYDPRKRIDLAYAITTHKSQGSEYKHVCYVINKSTRFIQCRSNLYTGVTRARENVHLICDQQSITTSVGNVMSMMDRKDAS